MVDAGAAVAMAKVWTDNLLPLQSETVESSDPSVRIPDAPAIGDPTTVSQTLTMDTGIEFIEFVEVNLTFQHDSFRDLEIELESPSGAVSQLTVPFDTFDDDDPEFEFVPLRGSFRFGSARHLGEDPNGVWKLIVTDQYRPQGWNSGVVGRHCIWARPNARRSRLGIGHARPRFSDHPLDGTQPDRWRAGHLI